MQIHHMGYGVDVSSKLSSVAVTPEDAREQNHSASWSSSRSTTSKKRTTHYASDRQLSILENAPSEEASGKVAASWTASSKSPSGLPPGAALYPLTPVQPLTHPPANPVYAQGPHRCIDQRAPSILAELKTNLSLKDGRDIQGLPAASRLCDRPVRAPKGRQYAQRTRVVCFTSGISPHWFPWNTLRVSGS